MPYTCDLHSVGVLITRTISEEKHLLLITRSDGKGRAPVAGHVYDAHTGPIDAAIAEAREEAGLDLDPGSLTQHAQGWRHNRCSGRIPHPALKPGHMWWIFEATAAGEPTPCPDETRGYEWADRNRLQHLAQRTDAYARGRITPQQWQDEPGLEPVWCHWLWELEAISLLKTARTRIEVLADTPPRSA